MLGSQRLSDALHRFFSQNLGRGICIMRVSRIFTGHAASQCSEVFKLLWQRAAQMTHQAVKTKTQPFSEMQRAIKPCRAEFRVTAAGQAEHFHHRPHHSLNQAVADTGTWWQVHMRSGIHGVTS